MNTTEPNAYEIVNALQVIEEQSIWTSTEVSRVQKERNDRKSDKAAVFEASTRTRFDLPTESTQDVIGSCADVVTISDDWLVGNERSTIASDIREILKGLDARIVGQAWDDQAFLITGLKRTER